MALPALLTSLLGTTAGKAVAGLTVAAASVGGIAATDVVELPSQAGDRPAEVTTDDAAETPELPTEAEDGRAVAEANKAEAERNRLEAQANRDAARENGEDAGEGAGDGSDEADDAEAGGEPDANAAFGQSVAADAREGGVDGPVIAEAARNQDRSADVGEADGARQDADVRQDGDVRQDADAPHGADAAGEHRPADAGTPADAAGEHRPESAGRPDRP